MFSSTNIAPTLSLLTSEISLRKSNEIQSSIRIEIQDTQMDNVDNATTANGVAEPKMYNNDNAGNNVTARRF